MKSCNELLRGVALAAAMTLLPMGAQATEGEILARVGGLSVSATDLEAALASSPFATQFVAMDEGDQAALRGDLLRRLVAQRLLSLEAEASGIADSPAFSRELDNFRMGLLYRHYMDRLRERSTVPEDVESRLQSDYRNDPDAASAVRSSYLSEQYRTERFVTLQMLRERYHVKLHEDRIGSDSKPDTLLLEGDGVAVRYGELVDAELYPTPPNPEWVKEQLYKRAELLLIAKAAEAEGVDVSDRVAGYRNERLPALLLEQKEREWIPDEKVLRDYFEQHPEIGMIPERWHIGQLVTSTREEAEALRKRIVAGESLFRLASQYSIDPYGKGRNGDMGWVRQGRGMPQLEQALSGLEDGEVSEVVESPQGFHLVTIIERRPGGSKPFPSVADRARQMLIAEKLSVYIQGLEKKHPVEWQLLEPPKEARR